MQTPVRFHSDGLVSALPLGIAEVFEKIGLLSYLPPKPTASLYPLTEKELQREFTVHDGEELNAFRAGVAKIRGAIECARNVPVSDPKVSELRDEFLAGMLAGLEDALHDSCFDAYHTAEEFAGQEEGYDAEEAHQRAETAMQRGG